MSILKRSFAVAFCAAVLGLAGCASTPGHNNYFDDAMVTARVKKAIFDEPALKVTDISVKTENAVVSLSGAVKSRNDRTKAAEVARHVDGVKLVKNELKIDPRVQ
ncbi:MAG: BON domain-containing protein [Burkholderiales bacterium]